ncbi:hypothetical protein C4587_00950 [Candidatus Parcubacteria bacterium]|nr:MAG: hypothetical protein C4587_00950 [Candidatus Parcubacteria bacterium]
MRAGAFRQSKGSEMAEVAKTVPVVGTGASGDLARTVVASALGFAAAKGWIPMEWVNAHPEVAGGLAVMLAAGWQLVATKMKW